MKLMVGPREGMPVGTPEVIQEISGAQAEDNFHFKFHTEEDLGNMERLEELPAAGLVGMVSVQRAYDPSIGRDGIVVNLYLPSGNRWAITSFTRNFMRNVAGVSSDHIPPTQEQRDVMRAEEQEVLAGTLEDLSDSNLRVLGAFLLIRDDSEPPVTASQLLVSKALQERWDFLLRDKALLAKAIGYKPRDVVEEAEVSQRAVLDPNMQSFAVLTLLKLMTNPTTDIPRHLSRLAHPR